MNAINKEADDELKNQIMIVWKLQQQKMNRINQSLINLKQKHIQQMK